MRLARLAVVGALLAVLAIGPAAQAADSAFIPRGAINLFVLLAPPPSPQDPRTQAELEELRHLEATRTPARVATAQADAEESVFRLTVALGKALTPAQVPKTVVFFQDLLTNNGVTAAKKSFARPRPYAVATDLKPVCPLSRSGAYPSGHATVGYYMGVVLAAMLPEQREAIFARTQEFAESRLVCGVHYRSDIEAGRIAGTALAAVAMTNANFQARFTEARAELRAALGF
jgi:acid phosphatase (class A)